MACEKYANQIVDAAWDQPHLGHEGELLAHLSVCASCTEKLREARWLRSSIDRSIETVVSGDPSPHFVARIRAQIATAPAPRRAPFTKWASAGVTATALAILLALWLLRGSGHDGVRPAPVADLMKSPAGLVPSPARLPILPLRHPSHRTPQPVRSSGPEVLVPPGQLALALQLSQGLVSGRTNGEALFAAQQEFEKPVDAISPAGTAPTEDSSHIAPPDSGGF